MTVHEARRSAINKPFYAELATPDPCKPWIWRSNTDHQIDVLDRKVNELIDERDMELKISIDVYQIEDGRQSMPPPVGSRKINSHAPGDLALLVKNGLP